MRSLSSNRDPVQRTSAMNESELPSKTPPEFNLATSEAESEVAEREPEPMVSDGPIQAYMESTLNGAAAQVSSDLSLATVPEDSHGLYAASGMVNESNEKLEAVGAKIRLQETGETGEVEAEGKKKTLNKVLPMNMFNGTSGEDMQLYADCGRSNSMVTGSLDRKANYTDLKGKEKQSKSGDPAAMKLEIFRHVFDTLKNDPEYAENASLQRVVTTFYKYEKQSYDLQDEIAAATDERTEAKLKKKQSLYWQRMLEAYDRIPGRTRKKFDEELGINDFANPDVGEGYTISSGGNYHANMKDQTWNFHWGGVVMKSNNGKDNVTLENYAVGDWDAQNNDWAYAMYGVGSEGKQSFHSKMNATKGFGKRPTTMAIGKRWSGGR